MSDKKDPKQPDPPTTNRDRDCAALARAALFPLQINRDGSHRTIFPAVQALDKIRDDLIARFPDLAASSFFPRRVVLVRAVAGNPNGMHNGQWQWNGQPDVDETQATVEVIPQRLSVKCMACNDIMKHTNDFLRDKQAVYYGEPVQETELVLCTDRLLQQDYQPEQMMDFNQPPPKSLHAVEEALAHQLTKFRDQTNGKLSPTDNNNNNKDLCQQLAQTELRAARAAECYFQATKNAKNGRKEVQKGSQLPTGYSWSPFQSWHMRRCLSSVATKALQGSPECETARVTQACVQKGLKDEAYLR